MYYQVPLYRRLAREPKIDFTAIFCSSGGLRPHDAGFGSPVTWDVDLLSGYHSLFLARSNRNPIGGTFLTLRDFDVVERIREGDYDVLWLHGYNFVTNQLAALTQIVRGKALLFREEQTLIHSRPLWKSAIKAAWLRTLFARSFALYIGNQNKKWFQSFGVPESRMFFVPYAADNDLLQADADRFGPARSASREAFNLPAEGVPVILFVGRLVAKKQPSFLLDAYSRVRRELPCALMIVGSGELEPSLRAKVAREQIPDVHFAGFLNRTQISQAYVAADVFALPSREHETWGMVVNEAMNFSLPIVVTDKVGCADDLVRDGENGFVVSSEDSSDLAERLCQLIRSDDLRHRFGSASRQIVSRWSHDLAANGVLDATAAAVGAKRWGRASETRSRVGTDQLP
jgi:glycosyltransferase involved in cell wall biosynthesis